MLRGQLQGVGFRPYVYRLAHRHGVGGYVANSSRGVIIEVEGAASAIAAFETDLLALTGGPMLAVIDEVSRETLPVLGEATFVIRPSSHAGDDKPEVTPDAAVCSDCLTELFDPTDRRHRYPFINCTNCGPRYSIIRATPYDRPATTMATFTMCPACQSEYEDPLDRRFHAQPNACSACGPTLRLCLPDRSRVDVDPIVDAARRLVDGEILAVKGIGGFHLACRADSEEVVSRLRERKLRDGKPLAVMIGKADDAGRFAEATRSELDALASASAPIVLMRRRPDCTLAPSVAPNCPNVALMLPYAPHHHLLFAQGIPPLVMTSANLSGLPLTYTDDDAFEQLSDVADAFLTHDREIHRPIDDSVVSVFQDRPTPVRRARGYAPRSLWLPIATPTEIERQPRVLAVGGELKSAVALMFDGKVVLSEHLGDLMRPQTYRSFIAAIDRLKKLYEFEPDVIAHDLHPRYLSTTYATGFGIETTAVQHHHAHIVAVMAEHGLTEPVIGLSCDGTGYGTDAAVWGCEVLRCERHAFDRLGQLEYFPLVGGDAAAVQTWRPAASLAFAALGPAWKTEVGGVFDSVPNADLANFESQLSSGVNCPATSSLGRLFDAAAFLLGLCPLNRHEAEAAMALEAAAREEAAEPFGYEIADEDGYLTIRSAPMIRELIEAIRHGQPEDLLAARFHETVARMLVDAAAGACESSQIGTVALSGGCFANRRLLARVVELLESRNLRVVHPRQAPCGDGGLALGQAVAATEIIRRREGES